MRLDEVAIKRLDLYARSSQLVTDSGFTDEELKEMKSSHALLTEDARGAYRSAYSTWYKPTDDYQAQLDYVVTNTIHSKDYRKLSPKSRALSDSYLAKFENMMVKAHSLGKNDSQKRRAHSDVARTSVAIQSQTLRCELNRKNEI
jgi:hypothetical protein